MLRLATALMVLFLLAACDPSLRVSFRGNNPPVFLLRGDDRLHEFWVCCEDQSGPANEKNSLWLIVPDGDRPAPSTITYGVVPPGFIQTRPENNQAPPRLEEGKRYSCSFVRYWGGGGDCFEISAGKTTHVECQ